MVKDESDDHDGINIDISKPDRRQELLDRMERLVTFESANPASHNYWLLLNVNIPSIHRVNNLLKRHSYRFPNPIQKSRFPFPFIPVENIRNQLL